MLNLEVLSDKQMESIDQRQTQQQADWQSIPSDGMKTRFIGIELTILPGVFPPKRDTQLLPELLTLGKTESVLDVGTGTGALAIWAATQSDASVIAIDISEAACRNARLNIENLALGNRIQVRPGSMNSCLQQDESFDVVIANLPGRNKRATNQISAAQWDTDFQAHKELFAQSQIRLRNEGKIFMVKANYPDLLEMIDLARTFNLQTEVLGKSEATADDPRIYYALSLTKLEVGDL